MVFPPLPPQPPLTQDFAVRMQVRGGSNRKVSSLNIIFGTTFDLINRYMYMYMYIYIYVYMYFVVCIYFYIVYVYIYIYYLYIYI